MKLKARFIIAATVTALIMAGCGKPTVPKTFTQQGRCPKIFPDYTNVVVPPNIAPLNFMVQERGTDVVARFTSNGKEYVYGEKHDVIIPEKDWKNICQESKGKDVKVDVFVKEGDRWTAFKSFNISIAEEEIDPYISYRVIFPSYVAYEMLSINQRNITNYEEKVIYNNMMISTEAKGQCINCHSYQNYRTENMQFHMRQGYGGTMIVQGKKLTKVDLKSDSTISSGVYPTWHPTMNLIAYSTNSTGQSFHTMSKYKIEVQDTKSDLILYNVDKNEVTTISADTTEWEIYPWWAPTGDMLYYCSAHFEFQDTIPHQTELIKRYKELKYDIYRMKFDPKTLTFGPRETVFKASEIGKSATLPRISPDGRYLLFAMGDWGCFHIWHPDADLWIKDLKTDEVRKLENVNSPETESYHSWSSNGRWILFSSRRDDGNYTRLYIAYFDKNGKAHKAFELPQKDPAFYTYYLRSYNIPEFMVEPVKVSPQEFVKAALKDAVKAKYNGKDVEQEADTTTHTVN